MKFDLEPYGYVGDDPCEYLRQGLPIKAKSRFKDSPCGNEHDVFQKQTEGLLGWTEINKGDTCMKVNSRRRQRVRLHLSL